MDSRTDCGDWWDHISISFHSQVYDGNTKTTLYKVRCQGYDKEDDTWESITHVQGYATMWGVISCGWEYIWKTDVPYQYDAQGTSKSLSIEKICQPTVTPGSSSGEVNQREFQKKPRFLTPLMTTSIRKTSVFGWPGDSCQGTLMWTTVTYPDVVRLWCGACDSSMVLLHLKVGESFLQLENNITWMLSTKTLWTRRWKTHCIQESIPG